MSVRDHLPINRGFASSFGYLAGAEDHYADTRGAFVDLWRSGSPAYGENGTVGDLTYNTFKFTKEALSIVGNHPPMQPLLLYLAYQNVHGITSLSVCQRFSGSLPPCLPVSLSPCLPVSLSPFLSVSLSLCLFPSRSLLH